MPDGPLDVLLTDREKIATLHDRRPVQTGRCASLVGRIDQHLGRFICVTNISRNHRHDGIAESRIVAVILKYKCGPILAALSVCVRELDDYDVAPFH
jgi:hypothetical protein